MSEAAPAVDTNTPAPETGAEATELSLRDELGANLEIAEKGPESTDLSEAARKLAGARKGRQPKEPASPTDDEKREADDKAKRDAEYAKLAPEERAKREAEDKRKAEEAASAAKIEAPAHWPAADREMFAKQPPEVKQYLLGRHKAMEADYTKKMQELAPMRRMGEELDDIFKDYDAEMKQTGITRAQAIRELVGLHARLKADPVEGLKYIAGLSGIDLKQLANAPAADPAGESPIVKELRSTVSRLEGQLKTFTGQQGEQQLNARLSEVQQFAEEKDAQGQLKRPYFDEVAKDVAVIIHASRANGEKLSLQDAYDRAVYANPTTRQKVLAAQDAERRTREEAERKAKADAARRAAAGNVEGEGSATALNKTEGSLRGDLEAAMADWGGRV